MKIIGNSLQKGFLVKHNGKEYYINYLDIDYNSSVLMNRDNWEIFDEDDEEISPYQFKSSKNKKEINLYYKLVEFCIKNFNHYNPKTLTL